LLAGTGRELRLNFAIVKFSMIKNKINNLIKKSVKRDTVLWKTIAALFNLTRKTKINLLVKYFSSRKWLEEKKYKILFEIAHKNRNERVMVILNDFADYPLFREKILFGNVVKCGIGNLFENMTKYRAGMEYDIILIINFSDDQEPKGKQDLYISLQNKYPFIKKVIFRDNAGFDFGSYNMGYRYLLDIGYEGDVLFMNSSVRGPHNDYWLLKYSYLFNRNRNIGLCGISLNSHATHLRKSEFKPHVQSFFMYTNMKILKKIFDGILPGADITSGDHSDVISAGEIGFSQRFIDNGYGICSALFNDFVYYKGSRWMIPFGDTRFNDIYHQFANKI